jgi:hypothetical protein
MPDSILLRQQLRQSIADDVAARIKIHQTRIARFKTGRMNLMAAGAPAAPAPLTMLAHGDSWFDYPLTGNGLPITNTDIIAQLVTMGAVNPLIANVSHHGDATTAEMSLPKQERMIDALQDPDNWLDGGKPDAILFSGGGNDIAGDQFCIFLDYAGGGLNAARFDDALGTVEASYMDLFAFRDRYASAVPIFGHCYDFPIPDGRHPVCAGPWLKPSLDFCGCTDVARGAAILQQVLLAFKGLLVRLANDPANNFVLVNTQGMLTPALWANELHPVPDGFRALAGKFVTALKAKFPGRI